MRNARREPKIDHFDTLFGLIEQYILKFDVSMCDVSLMTVINRLHDLLPDEFGFHFRHLAVGFHLEVAVKTASIYEFHDKEDLLMRFKCLIKLRNIWMI